MGIYRPAFFKTSAGRYKKDDLYKVSRRKNKNNSKLRRTDKLINSLMMYFKVL